MKIEFITDNEKKDLNKLTNHILFFELFYLYSDKIEERIKKRKINKSFSLYVGDCVNYAIKHYKHNNYFSNDESYEEIVNIVSLIVKICLQKQQIIARPMWINDLNYILVIC